MSTEFMIPALTREMLVKLIADHPGISDREIAEHLYGPDSPGTTVNPLCRELADAGRTMRRFRPDYLLGNWLAWDPPAQ
jgi:hypothetical protein